VERQEVTLVLSFPLDWINSGGSQKNTNATYTGVIDSSSTWNLTGVTLGDVRTNATYTPMSMFNQHQIIQIDGSGFLDPYDISANASSAATMGPTALFYNLTGFCWQGGSEPALAWTLTNPVGCTGDPANGIIDIYTDLVTFNLENCDIQWTHPANSNPGYSAGTSNHNGAYGSIVGGSPGPTGVGGAFYVTGLVA
jgi:hypothetical protein